MDKIRYDFEQARRQIRQIRSLHEAAQDCLGQARRARSEMMDLGDGDVVRLLTDALEARIRDGQKLCDRLDSLESALRQNLQRFEDMEAELVRSVQGIGEENGVVRLKGGVPLISRAQCIIGESRFAGLIYPDFLTQAAEKFFSSNL